jgi:putative methionine-R-sulfoxide reductase with GAF domain
MQPAELRRLIIRHRHVAPMLTMLLASTDAKVHITDADGETVLDRDSRASEEDASIERHPIVVESETVGWVEGPRPASAIASVLSYACSRETDKRSLASEALDRYRELNLIYDLADRIAGSPHLADVTAVAIGEAGRLPTGGVGFLLLESPTLGLLTPHPVGDEGALFPEQSATAGLLGAAYAGDPEIVNDVAADSRATTTDRVAASLIVAPLKVEGARLGVVGTASKEPVQFQAGDLKILTAIAALTAPFVSQAERYESIARGDE